MRTHKYKKRVPLSAGGFRYVYEEPKGKVAAASKYKIAHFYGQHKHKYFITAEAKANFEARVAAGQAGVRTGRKHAFSSRLKIGTRVTYTKVGGAPIHVSVVGVVYTKRGRAPELFHVEYKDAAGKIHRINNVPRTQLHKTDVVQPTKKVKTIPAEIQIEARKLAEANWKQFAAMATSYYKKRMRSGFDANKSGFSEADLRQEVYILLQSAAESYLVGKAKTQVTFADYVKSFLKSNLAMKMAANSDLAGHLGASTTKAINTAFFKRVQQIESTKLHRSPPGAELLAALQHEQVALPDSKGNRTVRRFKWTPAAVAEYSRATQATVSVDTAETEPTLQAEDTDPFEFAKQSILRQSLLQSIQQHFKQQTDRDILLRSFGIAADDTVPTQQLAAESASSVARYLNSTSGTATWTATAVEDRLRQLLLQLQQDAELKSKLADFVKSKITLPRDRAYAIAYYLLLYSVVSTALDKLKYTN